MIASVDGCKGGWLVAKSESWPFNESLRFETHSSFNSVLQATDSCTNVVLDMPIGLPPGPEPRACDLAARQALGSVGQSRVFLTPPRPCLKATCPEEFQRMYRGLANKGAGIPVWGIVDKLIQVDTAMTPQLQQRVVEFHPELAWKRLAGRVLPSKHSARGSLERLRELAKQNAPMLWQLSTDGFDSAALDDVLDAIIGLSVASSLARDPAYRGKLPGGETPTDERGLKTEIWF